MTYRDNIDKLARRITDRIPAKVKKLSQTDPEYECLNEILNDEQCDLCLCFEVRKPLSFEEVVSEVEKYIEEMKKWVASRKSESCIK